MAVRLLDATALLYRSVEGGGEGRTRDTIESGEKGPYRVIKPGNTFILRNRETFLK